MAKNFFFCALCFISFSAKAFVCSQNGGPWFDAGTRDLFINVSPVVGPNENIIFDSGTQIMCRNVAGSGIDWLYAMPGTKLEGALSSVYNARAVGVGGNYAPTMFYVNLPVTKQTEIQGWRGETNQGSGHLVLKIVLSPLGDASGIPIKKGTKIATYNVRKEFHRPFEPLSPMNFTWNIYANNDIVVPTGGCDVNTRNINVKMEDYSTSQSDKDINLSIKCGRVRSVSLSLTGMTDSPEVFSNVSKNSPSSGLGISIVRNGTPLSVNTPIYIGNVGNAFQSLGLKARYALNGKVLTAGNVQSVIGVNFSYN